MITISALLMLSVTAGAFLLVTWIATKALFFFLPQYRPTGMGSAFGFHPRNDRTVPAVPG